MTPEEVLASREAVVREAMSWQGTPYHPNARVKGQGVDCLTFVVGVYENVGLIPKVDIPHYPPDWHFHTADPRYMDAVLQYCDEVSVPERGGLVMFRFARQFAHSAIVLNWPMIIHAHMPMGNPTGPEDAERSGELRRVGKSEDLVLGGKPRPKKFFTLKVWQQAA